ncbi:aldo/keto reductase [Oerskovia sp. M15]
MSSVESTRRFAINVDTRRPGEVDTTYAAGVDPASPNAAARRAQAGVHDSGTFALGGELGVHRIGFGTMQLTGPGSGARLETARVPSTCSARPPSESGPVRHRGLLRPGRRRGSAPRGAPPYRDQTVIATKGGFVRTGPAQWHPLARPEYLRQQVEMSLRRLRVDRIDLYQLHRIDPQVPLEDSIGELRDLQAEGKIRHIGMSEVGVAELDRARAITPSSRSRTGTT